MICIHFLHSFFWIWPDMLVVLPWALGISCRDSSQFQIGCWMVVDGARIPESTSLKVFDIASQLDMHYFHKMVFLITLFKLTKSQEDGIHLSTWLSLIRGCKSMSRSFNSKDHLGKALRCSIHWCPILRRTRHPYIHTTKSALVITLPIIKKEIDWGKRPQAFSYGMTVF